MPNFAKFVLKWDNNSKTKDCIYLSLKLKTKYKNVDIKFSAHDAFLWYVRYAQKLNIWKPNNPTVKIIF